MWENAGSANRAGRPPEENNRVSSSFENRIAGLPGARVMRNAHMVRLSLVKPDPGQPRKVFDEESMQELVRSIKQHGVIHPITVEFVAEENCYTIVSGERRFRACQVLEMEEIPCVIKRDLSPEKRYLEQLTENIIREDLNPIDKARGMLELKERLGKEINWAGVERIMGISETRRKQFIALLNLPLKIQRQIVSLGRKPAKNRITEKHARALLMLNKLPEKQSELFKEIKRSKKCISGDEAIERAKEMTGAKARRVLKITYQDKKELRRKLLEILDKLKRGHLGDPRKA